MSNVDNICPVTKEYCDDEACPPGAECNMWGDRLGLNEAPLEPLIWRWDFWRLGIDVIKVDDIAFGGYWSPWHCPVVEVHFWKWSVLVIWSR